MLNIHDDLFALIPEVGADALIILMLIGKRMDRANKAFPSYKTLMQESGFGEEKVQRLVHLLAEKQLVQMTRRRKNGRLSSYLYTVNTPLISVFVGLDKLQGTVDEETAKPLAKKRKAPVQSYLQPENKGVETTPWLPRGGEQGLENHTLTDPPVNTEEFLPPENKGVETTPWLPRGGEQGLENQGGSITHSPEVFNTPLPPKGGEVGGGYGAQVQSEESIRLMREAEAMAMKANPEHPIPTAWIAAWWDRFTRPANMPQALIDDLPQLFINAVMSAISANAHTPGYVQKAFKTNICNWKPDAVAPSVGASSVSKTVGQKLLEHPYLRHVAFAFRVVKTDGLKLMKIPNGFEFFEFPDGSQVDVTMFKKTDPTAEELEELNP